MERKNKVLYLLFFITFSLFSQIKNEYDFIGTLILEDNVLITYRIQFNIDKDSVNGYSYTDMNGKNETKSKIKGFYNKKDKSIKFKESDILYTKSKELSDIFCFVNIDAKIKLKNHKNSIQGPFIGLYNNKDTCATGKVILISLNDAFKKLNKVSKRISNLKKIDSLTKQKFTKEKFLSEIKPNTLKKDEVLSVFWKSKKFIIEIWDNGKEDGDLISLIHNNKTVFRKYEVRKIKKRIELELDEGENIIEILANNNGSIAPNTAKAILIDGEIIHSISTHLDAGKSSKINIIYKPN